MLPARWAERHANERWNNGDVEGPLEIYADDVTFFDPITAARLDGWTAVAEYFRTVWAGKVPIHRYEMINPQVASRNHLHHHSACWRSRVDGLGQASA